MSMARLRRLVSLSLLLASSEGGSTGRKVALMAGDAGGDISISDSSATSPTSTAASSDTLEVIAGCGAGEGDWGEDIAFAFAATHASLTWMGMSNTEESVVNCERTGAAGIGITVSFTWLPAGLSDLSEPLTVSDVPFLVGNISGASIAKVDGTKEGALYGRRTTRKK